MSAQKFKTIPIHTNKYLVEGCCGILNEEWPRSKTARLHVLEKSSDNFPYNLALVECHSDISVDVDRVSGSGDNGTENVTGHSRLCRVHNVEKACFIESVVIRKDRRGKGLGRVLMEETELAAKRLGFEVAYLTTRDKQDFYSHLGYEYCEPIVSMGNASKLLSDDHFQCLFGRSKPCNNSSRPTPCSSSTQSSCNSAQDRTLSSEAFVNKPAQTNRPNTGPTVIPPPPPPLPKSVSGRSGSGKAKNDVIKIQGTVYWMKKKL